MTAGDGLGYEEARARVLRGVTPLGARTLPVHEAVGLVLAQGAAARVDCPSMPTAGKDGYAVAGADLAAVEAGRPTALTVVGCAYAGGDGAPCVAPGRAVRVTTGAPLPPGAAGVVPVEHTRREGARVVCVAGDRGRRNVNGRARDVAKGVELAAAGQPVTPATAGLLAAGGLAAVKVHPRPRVGVLAIGDELAPAGAALRPGQLYASNLVTLMAWLAHFRMEARPRLVGDDPAAIRAAAEELLGDCDALLTSGGAWRSERDHTARVLGELGWRAAFRSVRMSPGKGVAFGLVGDKPAFCLPGGPGGNEVAFLQLALPGLLRLAAAPPAPFPVERARLEAPLRTSGPGWTRFLPVRLRHDGSGAWARPGERGDSRLRTQALADGLARVPGDVDRLEPGAEVDVQVLFASAAAAATEVSQ